MQLLTSLEDIYIVNRPRTGSPSSMQYIYAAAFMCPLHIKLTVIYTIMSCTIHLYRCISACVSELHTHIYPFLPPYTKRDSP